MPSYATHDPKGWLGNPKLGAVLGRPSIHKKDHLRPVKMTLRHIRLNNGGYDGMGCYFGIGQPLYWCASDDGSVDYMLRASNRNAAKCIVLAKYPNARFYN